jgi:hypothetical protein
MPAKKLSARLDKMAFFDPAHPNRLVLSDVEYIPLRHPREVDPGFWTAI